MQVRTVSDLSELESLREAWNSLHSESGATIFQSWEWSYFWSAIVLAGKPRMRLAVRILEDDAGRLQAILPLQERRIAGGVASIVEFVASATSTFNQFLTRQPDDGDFQMAAIECLRGVLTGAQVVLLRQLLGDAKLTGVLRAAGFAERQCDRAWIERDPERLDPLMRLSRSRRKQLRRGERQLRAAGEFEIGPCSDGEFNAAFDSMVALHHLRFASLGKDSRLYGRQVEFLKVVTGFWASSGKAEVIQLRSNGRMEAALLQVIDRERMYTLQGGFNPAFAAFSPMWLLDAYSISRAFNEHGCDRYEFGPVYQPYKLSWRPRLSESAFAVIGSRGLAGRALSAAVRMAFRRVARTTRVAAEDGPVAGTTAATSDDDSKSAQVAG